MNGQRAAAGDHGGDRKSATIDVPAAGNRVRESAAGGREGAAEPPASHFDILQMRPSTDRKFQGTVDFSTPPPPWQGRATRLRAASWKCK